MKKASLRERLSYKFDNFMAKGGSSIFISMMVVFIGLLVLLSAIRGIVLAMTTPDSGRLQFEGGFFRQAYITFLQMTDPGNMNHDVTSLATFKITAILAGLTGVIMLSMLIAFITTTLDQKISALKKGHSKVIEDGHTLILGWNERVIEILRELILANESEADECVVILASQEKEEMDDYLNLRLPDRLTTRVVTRSGNESSLVNLDVASVDKSRSVIILANCNVTSTAEERSISDSIAIKTVLAVIASRPPEEQLSIVVELFDQRNREIVRNISPDEITTIDANEVLAKILVQTSRSVGLSLVYAEIFSFDGCEMYFHHDDWNNVAFGDISYHFPDGVVMGIRKASGELMLRPDPEMLLDDDDDILILAEDDSTIDFQPQAMFNPPAYPEITSRMEAQVERELIIGWSPKCETILEEYAEYTKAGSSVDIMLRDEDNEVSAIVKRLDEELDELDITLIQADPLDVDQLKSVQPFEYDNIIILSQSGSKVVDSERTDSETIIILLLLRTIFADYPEESKNTKLITEVLDSENQALVAKTGVNDFIISNRVVSMLLAQISEDSEIARVYDDLFQEDGSEIYLKPASLYFDAFPVNVTFAELMRVAQARDEICLGVKIKANEQDPDVNYGVKLIPEKSTRYQFQADDCLVVLAEDDL